MFDALVPEIERTSHVEYGIAMGWFPDNLVRLAVTSLETCLKNSQFEGLEGAITNTLTHHLPQQFRNLLPEGYSEPLNGEMEGVLVQKVEERANQRRSFFHPFSRDYKTIRACAGLYAQSQNPYERLSLLKMISRCKNQSHILSMRRIFSEPSFIQDTIVANVLPLAGLEAMRGNFSQAISVLEDTMDEGYVWWDTMKNVLVSGLAGVYLLQGDLIRAECTFKEVQRRWYEPLEGDYGALLYNHRLALVLLQNNQIEKARKAFERAVSFLPKEIAAGYQENYHRLIEMKSSSLKT